jgi:transposase
MATEKKRFQHHSLEKKLSLIKKYESGIRLKRLADEYDVYPSLLKLWVRQYRTNGDSGLIMKNPSYTPDLKKKIVLEIIKDNLSLHQASINYCISRSVIDKWVNKARTLGLESLVEDGRGKSRKEVMGKSKSPKPLSREEELELVIERLRAENAYLKKLRALVEKRVDRENGNAPKSSMS